MIRLGGSVVTPTLYNLDEEGFFDFITDYNNYFYVDEDTVLNEIVTLGDITVSDYKLRTPWKFTTGAAVFLGKRGFITADVEFINYGKAHLESDDFLAGADNQTISNLYKSVANLRLGGEFRLQNFRIRGGYAYLPDPYNLNDGIDRSRSSFSGGAGYRNKKLFVDLAVIHTRWDSTYSPYTVEQSPSPIVDLNHQSTNGVLTLGFFF